MPPHGAWTAALRRRRGDRRSRPHTSTCGISIRRPSPYFRGGTNTEVNDFLDADFEHHARITLFGQFMLDDIHVTRKSVGDLKPTSFALTVGAKGGSPSAAMSWTLFYTQVASLTYQNDDNGGGPASIFYGDGIGRQFSDYDQATAKASLLVGPTCSSSSPRSTLCARGQDEIPISSTRW